MTKLVLDDNQAELLSDAGEHVEVVDRRGNVLGRLVRGVTDEDIAIAKQRAASDAPRYTTAEVLEYLSSLDRDASGTP